METINVSGLREFTSNLRSLDRGLPKTIRVAGNRAAEIVVADAKPKVPQRSGRAKKNIRVASSQREVRVRAGGKKVPYYAWLDFGGRVGRNRSVKRPFLKSGRYIWRAFADNRERVQSIYQDELINIARTAGLEVK